jgi:hypothetical protein
VIERLLKDALPGARSTRQGHLNRAARIAMLIEQRFAIRSPQCWQLKHIEWLLQNPLTQFAPATRRDYERTVRIIVDALGHTSHWMPRLKLGLVSGRRGARGQ